MDFEKPPNDRVEQPGPASGSPDESARPENETQANYRTLGRYQIQEELGRGAMGAVYKAFDPVIARTVALKTILIDDRAPDRAQMVERLKQEAKAAGGLDHPNIITIYDVGDENGAIYLSMQFVKGTTLAHVLADVGVPSLPTLLSWADQISAAVGFAHARGVIHRDLKPANLMVTEEGAIKVLDFGIAKIENTSLTQTGLVIGTPGYMSPEQITGKKIDHRADIFSLGAVFYELLTREKPFSGDIATILYKIVNEDPVAPSIINPAIPGGIDAVIRKALAKDPKDRFQTCEEMRQAFSEQSVRAPLATPINMATEKMAVSRPPTTPTARYVAPIEPTSPSIWPRLILGFVLVLVVVAGWSVYVRSMTGVFPPFVTNIESKIAPVLNSTAGKSGDTTTERHTAANDHSIPPASAPNAKPADAQATAAQPSTTPAASTPIAAPTLQPVSAQSPIDHPAGDNQSPSATQAASTPAETAAKPADHAAAESGDNTQTSNDKASAQDSTTASSDSHLDAARNDKQNPWSSAPKPPARRRAMEASSTVDGFTRQDVPDLLRQADSYATRGEYRLARYEYGLVLKLDHNNTQAREGLRRLSAAWQSR